MSHYVIGMDLGGTTLPCAVLDDKHNIVARHEVDTLRHEGQDAVINRMAQCILDVVAKAGLRTEQIMAAGVGAPGPLDGRKGIIIEAPNLKWYNVPLAAILSEKTGVKIVLENDANAAGWGEYWAGAGRGCSNMAMMTLGTGVGGAIVIDGKLLHGPDYTAGELGHVVVMAGGRECGCGGQGCLEAYASATATVSRFEEALKFGWNSSLKGKENISCADIFKAALNGDSLSEHIVAETGRYLGMAAATLANLLNPERLVISGGMIKAGAILFDAIRQTCKEQAFDTPAARMEIVPAELGENAGVIGAAGCALTRIQAGY